MTIRADYAEVCWEPVDSATGIGYYHDEEHWPHFRSRAECAERIADLHRYRDSDGAPLLVICKPAFATPCVVIVCDECGEQFDYEGDGGMHFDPADPMPYSITECDWTIEERAGQPDRHYCPECPGEWCEDPDSGCGELHHGACPECQPVPISSGQLELADMPF